MKTYSINEIFYSLQGEGFHAGRAAIFIRFAGCNLRCPFCDTNFSRGENMTADYILAKCRGLLPAGNPALPLIVLTGGEPTLQVDAELVSALHNCGYKTIAMETNGSGKIPAGVDFVTVSPKVGFVPSYPVNAAANEVKVVFDGNHDPDIWRTIFAEHYYLQPCDTGDPDRNREILADCIEYIKQHPVWRLSLQTQKITNIK